MAEGRKKKRDTVDEFLNGAAKKKKKKIDLSLIPEYLGEASKSRPLCASCGLFGHCRTPFMRPFIPKGWTGKVLGVGEAPGQHEDEESGRPFTGPAGKLRRGLFRRAGWEEKDVALVNAVRCRPRNNATPSMKQVRACRPFLLQVITKLNPKYIIGLGGTALRGLRNTGDANVTRARGKTFEIPGTKKKFSVTYHPASILYGNYHHEDLIVGDLEHLSRVTLRPPADMLPKAAEILGFDTEFDPDGNLVTIGVAGSDQAKAIETSDKSWRKRVAPLFKKAKIIAGHSIMGDLDYLSKYGLVKERWLRGKDIWDSYLLAKMYDENRGSGAYGLEALCCTELGVRPWKAPTEKILKKTGDIRQVLVEDRKERCRLDAWATLLLADHFMRKLKSE